jgi:hypothetical protein
MDGLIQIQAVVQVARERSAVGLDTQGRVWYGELSGAKPRARHTIKSTSIKERQWNAPTPDTRGPKARLLVRDFPCSITAQPIPETRRTFCRLSAPESRTALTDGSRIL